MPTASRLRLSAVAIALTLFTAALPASSQSWRATALATFDDVWQTIDESFYDPAFGGVDWARVKTELRPRVASASTMDDAREVIREMLARLGRSHFQLLGGSRANTVAGPAIVPADIRVVDRDIVITRVTTAEAKAAGLSAGQRLLAVDGRATTEVFRAVAGSDSRRRAFEAWHEVTRELHGADGSAAALRVIDPSGKESQITVRRARPTGEVITFGNLPPIAAEFEDRSEPAPDGRRVGYIAFNIWMPALGERIAAAVDRYREYDGIVIDLRGNPGGLAAMINGVAGHFFPEPVELGTMRTRQTKEPLSFKANPRIVTSDGRRVDVYRGRLAILVDELTGSTSEVFTGAMQSLGRARVFGRQSMGQALPALTKQLPSGDVLMYAIGDFTTSTGRSLEGAGVIPDEAVPLSIRELAAGRDRDLEAAIRWLSLRGKTP